MAHPSPFKVHTQDTQTKARTGTLQTGHGEVQTPTFMAVGTQATVKGLWPSQLRTAGADIVLGNTYHLALRPGSKIVAEQGGLHKFSGWNGPMLTDSGGFQVFSLKTMRKITEEGVKFRSHIDGSPLELSPETSMEIQNDLGADIIMAFDECPELPCDDNTMNKSLERTGRWLWRCKTAHQHHDKQHLFGIVQGGLNIELRRKSLELTEAVDLPGIAIGGLSVGETREERLAVLEGIADDLPQHKPHYLMGVGTPLDLVESVAQGIDMFDCVLPTREGRHGVAYTSQGKVRIKNQIHRHSTEPLDPDCPCETCSTMTKGYLRHLFAAGEHLGPMALSLHNLSYYFRLMKRVRTSIHEGTFSNLLREIQALYLEPPNNSTPAN
jgi:queuine tRNA-ribosyltransferase